MRFVMGRIIRKLALSVNRVSGRGHARTKDAALKRRHAINARGKRAHEHTAHSAPNGSLTCSSIS